MIKQFRIAGKGENEILEIVDLVESQRNVTDVFYLTVTCVDSQLVRSRPQRAVSLIAVQWLHTSPTRYWSWAGLLAPHTNSTYQKWLFCRQGYSNMPLFLGLRRFRCPSHMFLCVVLARIPLITHFCSVYSCHPCH
jgi:hypothetical protein